VHQPTLPSWDRRIKRQAHPSCKSPGSVRPFVLAWVFALAAMHGDPGRPMVLLLALLLSVHTNRAREATVPG
jgi:hypothetical protein